MVEWGIFFVVFSKKLRVKTWEILKEKTTDSEVHATAMK